jgi:hypothetical protein
MNDPLRPALHDALTGGGHAHAAAFALHRNRWALVHLDAPAKVHAAVARLDGVTQLPALGHDAPTSTHTAALNAALARHGVKKPPARSGAKAPGQKFRDWLQSVGRQADPNYSVGALRAGGG